MDAVTLLILVLVVGGLAIAGFLGALVLWAILTYIVKNNYPLIRRIAVWAARLDHFLPLLILAAILFVLIIFMLVVVLKLHLPTAVTGLLVLLLLVLLVLIIPIGTLLVLGIVVYLIKLIAWLATQWKRLLERFLPSVMHLKSKHEMGKGKDKDWTTHFVEMRSRLSAEADQARSRVSGLSAKAGLARPKISMKKKGTETEQGQPQESVSPPQNIEEPKMSLRDKMLMKTMSNKWVIKFMSIPIVIKIITAQMKAMFWVTSLFSRKKKETATEQGQPPESGNPQNIEEPKINMSWRDKMLMKMMSNKWVIKFMSIPIVMKIITAQMKAMFWVQARFSRKKKETATEQGNPPESGSPPPTQ